MEDNKVPLTKQKIKKILKEEIDNFIQEEDEKTGKKTVEVLEKLLGSIKDLDLSIDYLAAAVTGETPLGIGLSQSTLKRLAIAKTQAPAAPALAQKGAEE